MSSREPLYNTQQRSYKPMKAVLYADNFFFFERVWLLGVKLEVMVAREALQAGVTEALAHREPLQLSGGEEWPGPKCWFTLHFLHVLCELGHVPESSVTVSIHQMGLGMLFMP